MNVVEAPTSKPQNSESSDSELLRLIHIVRAHLWVFVATLVAGLAIGYLYTRTRTKVYQATASVEINPEQVRVLGQAGDEFNFVGAGNYWSNQEYYNTQVKRIGEYSLLARTVSLPALRPVVPDEPGADKPLVERLVQEDLPRQEKLTKATDILASNLSVRQEPESRVVNISVKHSDPVLAADLANRHIQTYLDFVEGLRAGGSENVTGFLSTEIERARAERDGANQKLQEFRAENGLLRFEEQQSQLAEKIRYFSDKLSAAEAEKKELALLKKRVKSVEGEDVLVSPIFGLMQRTEIANTLRRQYIDESSKLAQMAQEWGPKSQELKQQQRTVNTIKGMLEKEARVLIAEVEQRYRLANEKVAKFSGSIDSLRSQESRFDQMRVQEGNLEREAEAAEKTLALLTNRRDTSDISGRNPLDNVKPLDRARGARKVYPRGTVNMALAFLLSAGLGLGLVYLLEFMDRKIRSSEQLEALVGRPVLGVIPKLDAHQEDSARVEADLFIHYEPTSQVAECCRAIRTSILFSSAETKLKTIAIASAKPREGKTMTSFCLAITMAQSGQRVLLVDTDLRKPRVHKSLGLQSQKGLTSIILGESSIDESIQKTVVPNLSVLTSGPVPPNPVELLLTRRFREIISALEDRFDRVIFDSPPALPVTDAVVLSKITDGVILVAQSGNSLVGDTASVVRSFQDVNANLIGTILNGVDLNQKKYGYRYYGYGDDADRPDSDSDKAVA